MKRYLLILSILIPVLGFSQWSKTELRSQNVKKNQEKLEFSGLYRLNVQQLKQSLEVAPDRLSNKKGVIISLPAVSGKIEKFEVWEFSNMSPELQQKYPDIRSYVGKGIDDPTVYLRLSLSPVGFSSMITRSGISEFIEPYTEDRMIYAVFDSNARRGQDKEPFECGTKDELEKSIHGKNENETTQNKVAGFNIFRLALSCTGEYAQYHLTAAGTPSSATDAQKKAVILSAMNASLTRMNAVFERDLSLHFNLIANNDILVFLDPATDPYTSFNTISAHNAISSLIPATDYDMGHLIDKRNASGVAVLGVICNNSLKARGYTSCNFPEGDTFDIDYVAHEMGHQLGANHTFSYYLDGSGTSEVEPGSGTTIMAYTGIIGGIYDIQFNSNDYYHTFNVTEIKNKINSVACGTNTPFANAAPNISAGADYTIPKSTPYVLKGIVNDSNNSSYTYTWEQMNAADDSQTYNNCLAYPTKPSGPNFRNQVPVSNLNRYLPDFNKVLAGVLSTRWESVSSVARTLDFAFTARSNNPNSPQTSIDNMIVTVNSGAGPFKVTAPIFGQSLSSGGLINVMWDVASTNQAPINTSTVNIKLSTDGGLTFTTIVSNTPNDGSEQITIPSGSTSNNAFIMIEAVGNIYYAVSPSFVIDYIVSDESCNTYTYTGAAVPIIDGPGGTDISSPIVKLPLMVNNNGVITKIKVKPVVVHPNVRHISIGIESPIGTSVLIWNRNCNGVSGMTATFSDTGANFVCISPILGEIKSNESLEVFKGHKAQGEWNLFASDNNPGSSGSVTSWSLEVCTQTNQMLSTHEIISSLGDNIKIYPNPNDGNFFIKTQNIRGDIKLRMHDSSGRLVYSSSYKTDGNNTKEFNVNLIKGVYMISIDSLKGTYNSKLVIK